MKYLIIGAGGIGGAIAAYLAAEGNDTALLARGEHLRAIQKNGLTVRTVRRGDLHIPDMKAFADEDDFGKADVIFICVKGCSLMETLPVIEKAAHEKTLIIPIQNALDAGGKLGEALPRLTVLGGCVYTSSFIAEPGVITHPSQVFRIVFGARKGHPADPALTGQVASDLEKSGIDCVLSQDIELDIFKKFSFISPFATTDCYLDVTIGDIQKPGPGHDMFFKLLGELNGIAAAIGLDIGGDLAESAAKALNGFDPSVTSSMHKDLAAGRRFEKQELIFDVVELARKLGVAVPEYEKAAAHFGYMAT